MRAITGKIILLITGTEATWMGTVQVYASKCSLSSKAACLSSNLISGMLMPNPESCPQSHGLQENHTRDCPYNVMVQQIVFFINIDIAIKFSRCVTYNMAADTMGSSISTCVYEVHLVISGHE